MKTRLLLLSLFLMTVSVLSVIFVPQIYAQLIRCDSQSIWGRPICKGYFTGVDANNGTTVFNSGPMESNAVNNRNQFIDAYRDYLNGASQQNVVGAAATINIMLGEDGTRFASRQAGIDYARANFSRWETLINDLDGARLIDWDYSYPVGAHLSSGYDIDAQDFYTQNSIIDVLAVIRFRNPNGNPADSFYIDKWCGNIKGNGFIQPVSQSNLIAKNLVEDGSKKATEPLTLRGQIENNGNDPVNAITQARFCIFPGSYSPSARDQCYTSASGRVGSDVSVGTLAKGVARNVTSTTSWTASVVGSYTAYLCADVTNTVSDETADGAADNCTSDSFSLNAAPPPIYTISGSVFVDKNRNGNWDADDTAYLGSTLTVSINTSPGQSTATNTSGGYTFSNVQAGNYNVSTSVPSGYVTTSTTSRTILVSGDNYTVNLGITPVFTISGNVYIDVNKNGTKDLGELNYVGTPSIGYGRGTLTTTSSGTYSVSNISSGTINIVLTTLPVGYNMTYPLSGPPPSFQVAVGASCSTNGARGATCTAGNITNLSFGISNSDPWIQATCGDFRMDNGIDILLPNGMSALVANTTCATPGIAFSGNTTADFGRGQASSTNQVVGSPAYPEVYAPPSSGGIFSSYSYLNAKAQTKDSLTLNIASVCVLSNCTLPTNLPRGIYKANGDVTLNAYTFPVNQHYVFLIDGNLTMRGNTITPVGSSSVFSTSGNIIVLPTVGNAIADTSANLAGIFSTDRSFILNSGNNCTDLRLNLEGTLIVNAGHTGGSLQNDRDLCAGNATTPTLQMSQRLDYVLNLPDFVRLQRVTLEEVAP